MNILSKSPLLLLAILIALAGCNKSQSPAPPAPADPVLSVVRGQIDALNRKDLNGVMSALDSSNPNFEQTRGMTDKIFQTYDLRYTLKNLAVVSVNNDEARVSFSQTTEKISGPAFRNNQVDGVHTLKKINGEWKIASTQVAKVDYLDKQP